MRRPLWSLAASAMIMCVCCAAPLQEAVMQASPAPPAPPPLPLQVAPGPIMTYPQTRTVDQIDLLYGQQVRDPYRWLEDDKSPEVQAFLVLQDDLARSYLNGV